MASEKPASEKTVSEKPKTILMTADTVGGVWTYALELARALAPHGVNVALATMGAPLSSAQRAESAGVGNLLIYESGYKLEWMDDPWADVERAEEWLLALAAQVRPDVVHLNGYAHGALQWPAPVLMVGHSCVLSWWRAVKREDAAAEWSHYKREVARGLAAADVVVAPTRAMLSALIDHYGALPKGRVIPNGRSAVLFNPGRKEAFIFSAGRLWDEAKNVAALDAIAERLVWPVYVAGAERNPTGVSRALGRLRPLGHLPLSSVAEWLARAAIYALPARYEPFGLSAVEAGLSGCALVLGDIPSLREVWGDAAMFVPPDDADALCDALRRLMDDERLRRDCAERARAQALNYTPERMAAGYLSAYAELLAEANQHEEKMHARRDVLSLAAV